VEVGTEATPPIPVTNTPEKLTLTVKRTKGRVSVTLTK
jgi:hypothetical protein